jgi:hypothetical protein
VTLEAAAPARGGAPQGAAGGSHVRGGELAPAGVALEVQSVLNDLAQAVLGVGRERHGAFIAQTRNADRRCRLADHISVNDAHPAPRLLFFFPDTAVGDERTMRDDIYDQEYKG